MNFGAKGNAYRVSSLPPVTGLDLLNCVVNRDKVALGLTGAYEMPTIIEFQQCSISEWSYGSESEVKSEMPGIDRRRSRPCTDYAVLEAFLASKINPLRIRTLINNLSLFSNPYNNEAQ